MSTWDDHGDPWRSKNNRVYEEDKLPLGGGVAYPTNDGGDDDGGEILLSGGDYWRLDSSIRNENVTAFQPAAQRPPLSGHHARSGSFKFDPMTETMDGTGEWSKIRGEMSSGRELDEFVMLEKQLESMSAPHQVPRGVPQSVAKNEASTLRSSTTLDKFQVTSRTSDQASRPVVRNHPSPGYQQTTFHNRDHDDDDEDEMEQSLVGHTQYESDRNRHNGYSDDDAELDNQIKCVRPVVPRQDSIHESNTRRSISREKVTQSSRPVSAASSRSGGGERGIDVGKSSNSNGASEHEELRRYLTEKAKELEDELGTYAKENATLKKLRKEQESLMADKRAEVHKWAVEERQKTEIWCEEQKQAAARERSASAKVARDNRLALGSTGALGVRKERAEVEALLASIEKLKIDADAKEKKSKMNEKRLQQLAKDNAAHAEDIQQQLTAIEQNMQATWSYLDSIGVRLPGSLVRSSSTKRIEGHATAAVKPANLGFGSTTAPREGSVNLSHSKKTTHNLYHKSGSNTRSLAGTYAIEVDPEQLLVGTSDRTPQRGDGGLSESSVQRGALATAIFSNAGGVTNRKYDSEDSNGEHSTDTHQRSKSPSITGRQRLSESALRRSRPASSGGNGESADRGVANTPNILGTDSDSKSSWERSSRSSNARRYSDENELTERDYEIGTTDIRSDAAQDAQRSKGRDTLEKEKSSSGIQRNSFEMADTVKATHSASTSDLNYDRTDNKASLSKALPVEAPDYNRKSDKYAQSLTAELSSIASREAPRTGTSSTLPSTQSVPQSMPHSSSSSSSGSGRTEEVLQDGRRLISYRNGTRKELLPTGESLVRFVNGDTKTTGPGNSGVVVYYYAQANTTHTTYKDGLEVYEFPNRQVRPSDLI